MRPSEKSAMQHGNNVETLGFTAVPRKVDPEAAPAIDADVLRAVMSDSVQQIMVALQPQLMKAIAETGKLGVERALESHHSSVLGTFKAISLILAVRALLFLALAGAFALAWTAMGNPSWPSIIILISYVLLTVLPLVWLDRNGRRSSNE